MILDCFCWGYWTFLTLQLPALHYIYCCNFAWIIYIWRGSWLFSSVKEGILSNAHLVPNFTFIVNPRSVITTLPILRLSKYSLLTDPSIQIKRSLYQNLVDSMIDTHFWNILKLFGRCPLRNCHWFNFKLKRLSYSPSLTFINTNIVRLHWIIIEIQLLNFCFPIPSSSCSFLFWYKSYLVYLFVTERQT